MICLICRQAEVITGWTSVPFTRGEMQLLVNRVPAQICPNCEEAYVDETVAVWLLQAAGVIAETGVLQASIEYGVQQTS